MEKENLPAVIVTLWPVSGKRVGFKLESCPLTKVIFCLPGGEDGRSLAKIRHRPSFARHRNGMEPSPAYTQSQEAPIGSTRLYLGESRWSHFKVSNFKGFCDA